MIVLGEDVLENKSQHSANKVFVCVDFVDTRDTRDPLCGLSVGSL